MGTLTLLKVLIIGFGFMGENHFNNLKELEKEEVVCVAGIVEQDPSKLNIEKLASLTDSCFTQLEDAYARGRSYDIVVIATNTAAHYKVIQELLDLCVRHNKPFPALFVEKPLVETVEQAKEIAQKLKQCGYETTLPFTCGYLFRESPALDQAINYLQEHHLTALRVHTLWQKLRDTNRPSAGVHIDEATHPIDLLINYLLPALRLPDQEIILKVTHREHSSTIVNQKLQTQLYGQDHVPLATVDYEMVVRGIPITGHASFKEAPQRREIWIDCDQNYTLQLAFDKDKSDTLTVYALGKEVASYVFKRPNKLLLEWKSFLTSFQEIKQTTQPQQQVQKTSSLAESLLDIEITQALGSEEIGKICFLDNVRERKAAPIFGS